MNQISQTNQEAQINSPLEIPGIANNAKKPKNPSCQLFRLFLVFIQCKKYPTI
jgi:hypothetical protein